MLRKDGTPCKIVEKKAGFRANGLAVITSLNMKHRSTPAGLIFWLVVTNLSVVTRAEPHTFIAINRDLEIIKPRRGRQALRRQFEQAGKLLGNWKIVIAGIEIDGPRLVRISQSSPKEPFVRLVREDLRIPVDVADFVYFIDDVLAA